MGSSRLADALTGLSIAQGEPVVALVVERRTGGYPDATTHAANAPMSASEMFEPVTLPIRAKAGDYGDIEPRRGDLGATVLLDLANKKDWQSLSEQAFGVNAGIKLGEAARDGKRSPFFSAKDDEPRVLGIVAFREASWKGLVGLGTQGLSRKKDVETVLDAVAKVRAAALAGDNQAFGMNLDLAALRSSYLYERDGEGGEVKDTRLPALSRAFANREGGSLVSPTLTWWLTRGGMMGAKLFRSEETSKAFVELLGQAWDLQAAERGMDVLCKTWQPSFGAGQYDNAREVAESAILALEASAGRMLSKVEEGMEEVEDAAPRIEGLMSRLEGIRDSLAERLAAAREEEAGFRP